MKILIILVLNITCLLANDTGKGKYFSFKLPRLPFKLVKPNEVIAHGSGSSDEYNRTHLLQPETEKPEDNVGQYQITESEVERNATTSAVPESTQTKWPKLPIPHLWKPKIPNLWKSKITQLFKPKVTTLTTRKVEYKTVYNTIYPSCLNLENVVSVCDESSSTITPTKVSVVENGTWSTNLPQLPPNFEGVSGKVNDALEEDNEENAEEAISPTITFRMESTIAPSIYLDETSLLEQTFVSEYDDHFSKFDKSRTSTPALSKITPPIDFIRMISDTETVTEDRITQPTTLKNFDSERRSEDHEENTTSENKFTNSQTTLTESQSFLYNKHATPANEAFTFNHNSPISEQSETDLTTHPTSNINPIVGQFQTGSSRAGTQKISIDTHPGSLFNFTSSPGADDVRLLEELEGNNLAAINPSTTSETKSTAAPFLHTHKRSLSIQAAMSEIDYPFPEAANKADLHTPALSTINMKEDLPTVPLPSFLKPKVEYVTEYLRITTTTNIWDNSKMATVVVEHCIPADLNLPLCPSTTDEYIMEPFPPLYKPVQFPPIFYKPNTDTIWDTSDLAVPLVPPDSAHIPNEPTLTSDSVIGNIASSTGTQQVDKSGFPILSNPIVHLHPEYAMERFIDRIKAKIHNVAINDLNRLISQGNIERIYGPINTE